VRRRTLALPTLPPCADERRPSAYARATAVAARQVHRKLVRRVFLRRYGPEYESRSKDESAERTVELSAECADEGHAQRNNMCTTWLLAARSYMLKRVVTVHCFQAARCASLSPKAERVRITAGCGIGGGIKRMDLAPADADARQRGCVTGETGSV